MAWLWCLWSLSLAAEPRTDEAWLSRHDATAGRGSPRPTCPPREEKAKPRPEPSARDWPLWEIDLAEGTGPAEVLAVARAPARVVELPLGGKADDVARVKSALSRPGARVGIWGDSHSARGPFVNALRAVVQGALGTGGLGFVPAVRPGQYVDSPGVTACGVGDWSRRAPVGKAAELTQGLGPRLDLVEARDPNAYGWVFASEPVSRMVLLFERHAAGGALSVSVDDVPPVAVTTAGEGPGAVAFDVTEGKHLLRYAPRGDGAVRLSGVLLERAGTGAVVDNLAVSGAVFASWQRAAPASIGAWAQWLRHDLAVLEYGTNEVGAYRFDRAAYRVELAASLAAFRAALPGTPCVVVGPPDRAWAREGERFAIFQGTGWVIEEQAALGPEYGCATWSFQAAMGGAGSAVAWRRATPAWLGADYMHLEKAGSAVVAGALARALGLPTDGSSAGAR